MISVARKGKEVRELSHDNDKCVGCGICSDLCPTSALKLGPVLPIARGILKKDFINMNEQNCVLCGLCSFACPFNALDLKINGVSAKTFQNYPKWDYGTKINDEECIYCGRCELYCPRDALFVNRELPKVEDLVRGHIETNEDKCINCRICKELCPSNAIEIKADKRSLEVDEISIDKSKCVYCKVCQKVCPENAIRIICTTCMDQEEIAPVKIDGYVMLDESQCVNCSWCEKTCPVNAISTIKPFEGEILLSETEDSACKGDGCHACTDVCPCNAVKIIDNKAVFNLDCCILCGACKKVCPQHVIEINRKTIRLNNIKSSSWNKILKELTV
ncbi:MAG: 4Fe-4S binding protein [Methanobrevibacter sp.]|jgi:4Fe-4S ferredoxin|nr:4Fe-4S binding protein [Candidatus Methanovirga meridionalis]